MLKKKQVKKLIVYVEMDRCTADAVAMSPASSWAGAA
jgi:formylmethanofuran dehydrogenase subunit E